MARTVLQININKELKDELKIKAIKEDRTITEILTQLIEEYIE